VSWRESRLPDVTKKERDILERAVQAVSEQASKTDALVDEALEEGLEGSHPLTVQAKMLRLELLRVKADLERELGELVSTAPTAVERFTGSLGSASRPDTGRMLSQRRTRSQ
jgi:hypothetical protein